MYLVITLLAVLPCLAISGSCLQFFSSSMYSPVNAIKSSLFSVSPFINTCCVSEIRSSLEKNPLLLFLFHVLSVVHKCFLGGGLWEARWPNG